MTHTFSLFFIYVIALASCSNSRDNNPIFENHQPNSKIYKDELAVELASPEATDFTYRLDKYSVVDGKEYLDIDIKGHGVNAKASVLVKNWHKIEGIRRTKGLGYIGAELKGIKIETERGGGKTEFVYMDVDRVID